MWLRPLSLLSVSASLLWLLSSLPLLLSFPVGPGVPYQLSQAQDWLVHPEVALSTTTELIQLDNQTMSLTNGLISRTFLTSPTLVTISYKNLVTGLNYFRTAKPEAQLSVLDRTVYNVGGVRAPFNNALWQPYYYQLAALPNAFVYEGYEVGPAQARFQWKPQRWSEMRDWPPKGLRLTASFRGPQSDIRVANLTVKVIYEVFDGIPVLQKFVQISNAATPAQSRTVTMTAGADGEEEEELDELERGGEQHEGADHGHRHPHPLSRSPPAHAHSHFHSHAFHEHHPNSAVPPSHSEQSYAASGLSSDPRYSLPSPSVYRNGAASDLSIFVTAVVVELLACPEHACDRVMSVETDYMPRHTQWDPRWSQNGAPYLNTTLWFQDADYAANDNDQNLQADATYYVSLLQVGYPEQGPSVVIGPGETWDSFHVLELCHDSEDEERQNLARRRWMRTLAPQGTENPIYWHLEDQANVIAAIDETEAAGFEMLIISYSSGFDAESSNATYLDFVRNFTAYAHSKRLLIGGYTLMQNPHSFPFADQVVGVNPANGGGFGIACFATEGHRLYRERLIAFVAATGIDLLETDGPYEGQPCDATYHAYHRGRADSQAAQDFFTQDFYRSLKVKDVYFTVPDPYWLNAGTNKEPIGYTDRWTNNAFEQHERLAIGRMYSYDGTTHYPPTMGWMVFNYEDYQPLNSSQQFYELALAQYLGNGIITCFRGANLYDTPQTLAITRRWSDFYKQHRTVLNGDILHVVRPNGQDVDVQFHVHPRSWPFDAVASNEVALGFMFNPTPYDVSAYSVRLSMYYAGLQSGDKVRIEWGAGMVLPWQPNGTASAVVDDGFGLQLHVPSFPAYHFLYFIVSQ